MVVHVSVPCQRGPRLYSTNLIKRLKMEKKRRADTVGNLPDEASIARLIGVILLRPNDRWDA